MSANLNYSERLNRHSFFSVREKAWHNCGIVVNHVPTAEEAITLAGLDFEVGKKPATIEYNGEEKHIPRKFGTYRTDTGQPFGTVGSIYKVIQNKVAFSFFDHVVGKGEAHYETAGCLNYGEVVFITVKLPDHISIQGKDFIDMYLFLLNYHDGSGPLMAAITPVRIVCNNTLNAALKNMEMKITIRHTASYEKNLLEAPKIMGVANKLTRDLGDVYTLMARKKLVDSELKEMILKSLATPAALNKMLTDEKISKQLQAKVEHVLEYVHTADSQQLETTRGTVWGAYNAVTGYLQNVKEWKSTENQFDSIFHGAGAQTTQKIFDLCLEKLK